MMILRIGNNSTNQFNFPIGNLPKRQTNKGFSFIEMMVAVAVLSFGIVIVSQAFLTSLNAFGYYLTHLQSQSFANEKIWEVSDKLMRKQFLSSEDTSGNSVVGNKSIDWSISVNPLDEKEEIFHLNIVLSWKEGKKTIEVRRDAYAGI